MKCNDLELGDQALSAFVERIAQDACEISPRFGHARVRSLISVMLRTRVHSCAECSSERTCDAVRPGLHLHDDALHLANSCAGNAADLADLGVHRDVLEARLASMLFGAFASVVVPGPGASPIPARRLHRSSAA